MNAPFAPPIIEPIHADACVSISGLKKNPAAVIAEAGRRQVAILNRNRPVAYVISPDVWESVCDLVDDIKIGEMMDARQDELADAVRVSLDDL